MNHSKVIDLYTKAGELVTYRPLSARLPAFLERFGPEQGFAVETELADTLSLKPGLLRLYEIILQAGRKPEDVGLPALASAGQTLVCRAVLRDGNGRVLATATAAKPILAYKDLEVLETAARQRLLAALGFGGEVLDTDENLDQHDQGLSGAPPAGPAPAPVPLAAAVSPAIPAGSAPATRDAAPAASEPAPETASGLAPAAPPALEPPAPEDDPALPMLRRQLAHLAKTRGVAPPAVATKVEAQAAIKRLLQRAAG